MLEKLLLLALELVCSPGRARHLSGLALVLGFVFLAACVRVIGVQFISPTS